MINTCSLCFSPLSSLWASKARFSCSWPCNSPWQVANIIPSSSVCNCANSSVELLMVLFSAVMSKFKFSSIVVRFAKYLFSHSGLKEAVKKCVNTCQLNALSCLPCHPLPYTCFIDPSAKKFTKIIDPMKSQVKYSSIQVFEYSSIWVFMYSCIHVFKYSCIHVFKYSSIQV